MLRAFEGDFELPEASSAYDSPSLRMLSINCFTPESKQTSAKGTRDEDLTEGSERPRMMWKVFEGLV